ncbi:MAG: sulfurtransferase TusA family protein [Gammaproteobacteria bacterium]|nr:sulfurtransferase TusA family protein [Gammaproteobacteria bacterium]
MVDLNTLDVRRLLCPMPVIKTQDRVKLLTVGDQLTILCTDPGVLYDIPSWCRINGHKVISCEEGNSEITIIVEVG